MHKQLVRIFAVLLVPSLLAEPITAGGLAATYHSACPAAPTPLIPLQVRFQDQALGEALATAWVPVLNIHAIRRVLSEFARKTVREGPPLALISSGRPGERVGRGGVAWLILKEEIIILGVIILLRALLHALFIQAYFTLDAVHMYIAQILIVVSVNFIFGLFHKN